MTSRDFAYWLQGFFELNDIDKNKANVNEVLSREQVTCIKNHLNMVFKHEIDPSHGDKDHQKKLSDAHKGSVQVGVQSISGAIDGLFLNC